MDKANRRKAFISNNKDYIDKFNEIAYCRGSMFDEYGDIQETTLNKEIEKLLDKLKNRGTLTGEADEARQFIRDEFNNFLERQSKKRFSLPKIASMTGIEFENYVANLLRQAGCSDVRSTPSTGDQGADLIAKRGSKTLIIQTKRHYNKINNKAVQEVYSALKYYDGDEAWVITWTTTIRGKYPKKPIIRKTNSYRMSST